MDDLGRIFDADLSIKVASKKLFQLDQILRKICEEIKSDLGFDFAAISLVDKERNIIEAVQGTQEVRWINLAKHYLEPDESLRDIQADIFYTQNIEVISGEDPRFDDCIYESCDHRDVIRIFLPILVIESVNDQDRFVQNWFHPGIVIDDSPVPKEQGQHQRYRLDVSEDYRQNTKVIGTFEAGYSDPNRQIPKSKVIELIAFMTTQALCIWEAQLADVLRVVVTETIKVMKANSATLHYLHKPNLENVNDSPYVYEELAGFLWRDYLRKCPPRPDGLGQTAIQNNQPQWISDSEELYLRNPGAYGEGLRAMAAFPVNVGEEMGVLYASHTQIHQFDDEEIQRGQFLARRAGEAIQYARIHRQTQYREKQLTTLHVIAQSLLDEQQEGKLLRDIAGNTRNILAADIVTIYEYIQSESRFLTPPDIAGKLLHQKSTSGQHSLGVPSWLVAQECNLYADVLQDYEIFQNSHFDKQERIQSVAGVKLVVGNEVVGVLFINYRRHQKFSDEEQQFIETLASHAAIAIKNRRSRDQWLENLVQIDRKIVTALDQTEDALLKLIVKRAVDVTDADLGEILLPNPMQQLLEVKSSHPDNVVYDIRTIRPGEGITGQVAINRQSQLVNDVQSNPQYVAGRTYIGSEVCVPLLDQNDQLLGILNVESYRKNAFTERHKRSLEGLANRAVMGLQTLKNNEKLRKTKGAKLLTVVRFEILHKLKNDLGAIRSLAEDIREASTGPIQEEAESILACLDEMQEDLVSARDSATESDEQTLTACDLVEALTCALYRVDLPDSIKIEIKVIENLPKVCSSKQILITILDNLIRNAKEAMQGNGCIWITSEALNDAFGCRVKIEVCDNGPGIDNEVFERLYEPTVSTKNTGMGLGLTTVKWHVESLEGIIEHDNQSGGGARFTVLLPAKPI
jgi:GAF domain-containing protein